MTEVYYYETEDKCWYTMQEKPPYDGYTGVVLVSTVAGKPDADACYTRFATYCDDLWYSLEYDEYTGVLRKMPVKGNILAYSRCLVPDWQNELRSL